MFYERNIYFDDVWSQRKHVIFHVHFLYGPRSTSCMGRGIGGSLTPHLPHSNTLTTGYNTKSQISAPKRPKSQISQYPLHPLSYVWAQVSGTITLIESAH